MYTSLASDNNKTRLPQWQQPPRYRMFVLGALAVTAMLITSLTGNFLYETIKRSGALPSETNIEDLHCGTTVSEARNRGCMYDLMANGWVPHQCYDQTLVDEFLSWGGTWYYDEAHTREIPEDVLFLGNLASFYPHDLHHDRHCLYTWRKLVNAAATGGLIDAESANPTHTEHCTNYLMGKINTPAIVSTRGFRRCIRMGSTY